MVLGLRRVALVSVAAVAAGVVGMVPAQAADSCGVPVAPNNNNSTNQAPAPVDDTASVRGGGSVTVDVVANDTDPDGDRLTAVSVSKASRGSACLTPEGKVLYQAEADQVGYVATFSYGVTDGDRYRTATVTVNVGALRPVAVQVTKRARGKKPAQVTFTNPNDVAVTLIAGNPERRRGLVERDLAPGASFVLKTKLRRPQFLAALESPNGDVTFINIGRVNTRTGKVHSEYVGDDFSEFERASASRLLRHR